MFNVLTVYFYCSEITGHQTLVQILRGSFSTASSPSVRKWTAFEQLCAMLPELAECGQTHLAGSVEYVCYFEEDGVVL